MLENEQIFECFVLLHFSRDDIQTFNSVTGQKQPTPVFLPGESQGRAFGRKGGVICISEVIDISPGNLDSILHFFQPSPTH